jgi:hypothetical protein
MLFQLVLLKLSAEQKTVKLLWVAYLSSKIFGFLFYIFWKHCVVIETRGHFGRHLFKLARKKPIAVLPFLLNCAFFDDLDEYRQLVRKKLQPYTRII